MGYFEMVDAVDIFVVLDHVQFVKKSWQQRNKIKTPSGVITLTVSIQREKRDNLIKDVKISYDRNNPLVKHWKTISLSYKKANFFNEYSHFFEKIYLTNFTYLRDLNVSLIKQICEILEIKTKIISSSELNYNKEKKGKNEDIISLCKSVGITSLYDAKGAEQFLDKSLFLENGIFLQFQEFNHPQYKQLWGEFEPYLSIIDLIFNEGKNSLKIIKSGKTN
jgi:hypothetical protein